MTQEAEEAKQSVIKLIPHAYAQFVQSYSGHAFWIICFEQLHYHEYKWRPNCGENEDDAWIKHAEALGLRKLS